MDFLKRKVITDPRTGASRLCQYVLKKGPKTGENCGRRTNGVLCARHRPKKPKTEERKVLVVERPKPKMTDAQTQTDGMSYKVPKVNNCRIWKFPVGLDFTLLGYVGDCAMLRRKKYIIKVKIPNNMESPAANGKWVMRRDSKKEHAKWVERT